MKKIIFILLIIGISIGIYAKPIKDLPENILQAVAKNLQVEDCMLSYDKPEIKLGNPYSWIVSYIPGQYKKGLLSVPCGAVADVKTIKLKYKILESNGGSVRFYGRYNTKVAYDYDYISAAFSKAVAPKCECVLNDLTKDKTVVISFDNQAWGENNLGFMQAVCFEFTGEATTIEIMNVELINSKGEVFDLYNYDWDLRAYEFAPGVDNRPFPKCDHTIYIGMSSLEGTCDLGRKRILRLKELLPNLGCDGNGYAPALAYFKDFYIKNNIPAYYQFGGSCDIEPIVSEYQAHLATPTGGGRDAEPGTGSFHHEFDWTNPNVIDGFKRAVARCGQMGIDQFQFIDAVWQYNPISSGYGQSTINEFRKALNEEDEGIPVGSTYGKTEKRMKFHEFLKDSAGVEITPQKAGFNSWDEYIPCLNGFSPSNEHNEWINRGGAAYNPYNYFLVIMLKHYFWVKLFALVGEEGMKNNCDIVAMPNGDNWGNANDYMGLVKCSTVKYLVDETHFYHPDHLLGGYAQLPVWKELLTKHGKHHRLISEIGLGGGCNIYLCPLFSYIMNYSLQNLGHYDSMQTDWVWGGVNENSDQNGVNGWTEFLFKAYGFNDATEDGGEREGEYKKVIRLVTPQGNTVAEIQKSSFDKLFYKGPYPYILMNTREYADLKPNPELIVLDTMNITQEFADELTSDVKKKKLNLFLHSYVAGAESDGVNWTNIWVHGNAINNDTLFEKLIGEVSCDKETVELNGTCDNGYAINYKGEYYNISKKAVALISYEDRPILSQIKVGKNYVFYYHINAGVDKELDNLVMDMVYNICKIKKEGETDNAYMQKYKLANGVESIVIYNRSSFENYPNPLVKHSCFKVYQPGAKAKVTINPTVVGDYVVYDFVNGEVVKETSSKNLTVEMEDLSANIYYIIPKSKASTFIKTLKERKDKLDYWSEKNNIEN